MHRGPTWPRRTSAGPATGGAARRRREGKRKRGTGHRWSLFLGATPGKKKKEPRLRHPHRPSSILGHRSAHESQNIKKGFGIVGVLVTYRMYQVGLLKRRLRSVMTNTIIVGQVGIEDHQPINPPLVSPCPRVKIPSQVCPEHYQQAKIKNKHLISTS